MYGSMDVGKQDNVKRISRLPLIAILLLSWILLNVQLGDRSLWVDEFLTLQMIRGAPQDVIAASAADLHPPLYFLTVRGWIDLAGSSDFAVRWPSIAFGLIGLALMPSIARRLLGAHTAVPAMFFVAAAPAFIEFSRMARYYSLTLMLGLLSTQLLLDALNDGRWKRWLAYGLAGLAITYTFYPAAILLIAHGCIVLPAHRSATRRWLASLAAIGLAFAPWLAAIAARQATTVASGTGADLARSGLGFLLGIASSLYTFSIGETIFPWRPEAWIGLIVFAILIVVGLRSAGRARWQVAGMFAVCIAFMSLVTTFVAVGTPFLNVPVRGLFALPFYTSIAAAGFAGPIPPGRKFILASALLIVWSIGHVDDFSGQQFLNPIYLTPAKEAAAYVRLNATESDLVISDYDSIFGYYFLRGESSPKHLYTDQVEDIAAVLRSDAPPRVWLATIGRDQTQRVSSADNVRRLLQEGYHLDRVERLLPVDPTYVQVKNFILRRETYTYRLTIELYVHD